MAANNRRQGQGQKGRPTPTDNRLLHYFLSCSNYQLAAEKKRPKINVVEPTICLRVAVFVRASLRFQFPHVPHETESESKPKLKLNII